MPWVRGTSDEAKEACRLAQRLYRGRDPKKVAANQKAFRDRNRERIREVDRLRHKRQREARLAEKATHPKPEHCEICGNKQDSVRYGLVFDHCHTSGAFRGWLCGRCNLVLGNVKDDIKVLRKMIEYLESRSAIYKTPSALST